MVDITNPLSSFEIGGSGGSGGNKKFIKSEIKVSKKENVLQSPKTKLKSQRNLYPPLPPINNEEIPPPPPPIDLTSGKMQSNFECKNPLMKWTKIKV